MGGCASKVKFSATIKIRLDASRVSMMSMGHERVRRNPSQSTHLLSPNDYDKRGAGRGESPREQGPEERLGDR